jgi:sigma54-dependent transcription regulator
MQQQPEVIGNDYLVIGTLDKADWRRSTKKPFNFEEMRTCLHDFKKVMSFEPTRYIWVKDDSK